VNVPLLDLKTQYARIQPEITKAIEEVCAQQSFILGAHVEQLERTNKVLFWAHMLSN